MYRFDSNPVFVEGGMWSSRLFCAAAAATAAALFLSNLLPIARSDWESSTRFSHANGGPLEMGHAGPAGEGEVRNSIGVKLVYITAGTFLRGSPPQELGRVGDEELTEAAAPGGDFLAGVCVEWEREALAAADHGVRVVTARTGIVLGAGGGALAKMLPPFKLGGGGPLGNGRQWMPWIHVADLARLYLHAAETTAIVGPMNAVAPEPVRNSEFTKALGRQLHRPAFMPAPYLGLRLLFGEFAQVLFASQRVIPRVALDTGFVFQFPEIAAALREILAPAA
jgi:NAD dependent epimerase/dehydratase family enzyme